MTRGRVPRRGDAEFHLLRRRQPGARTHPSFISAPECGVPDPTPVANLGFPAAHMIVVANMAPASSGALPSFTPATIASGEVSRPQIVLANPLPTLAALTFARHDRLAARPVRMPLPNAATTCGAAA